VGGGGVSGVSAAGVAGKRSGIAEYGLVSFGRALPGDRQMGAGLIPAVAELSQVLHVKGWSGLL
jgi:hypothetical protein